MAMTIEQMIGLFTGQARMHWAAAESALATGNYDLLAFNLTSTLDSHLMVGLLQWRQGQDNPQDSFAHVCKVALQGIDLLAQIAPARSHWKSFDVFPAAYCGLLLREPLNLPIEDTLTNCQCNPEALLPQCLDACIIAALRDKKPPSVWDALIADLKRNRRLTLLCSIYNAYLDIIMTQDPTNRTVATEVVKKATSLFRARRKDDFFAGGRGSDGGGFDNQYVVDYRLAAIIHSCLTISFDDLDESARMHYWKW